MTEPTKPTPGPWRTVEIGSEGIAIKSDIGDLRTDLQTIAMCGLNRANAHLLSAAPDMFEALINFCKEVEMEWCDMCGGKRPNHSRDCPVTIARGALAKARGESE